MTDLTRRTATINDMKAVWSLVREVAADLPVELSTDAGQESALTQIMIGCSSALSAVAVDKEKAIVGALLVHRDENEWGLWNGNVLHVAAAAIAPAYKDQGLLQAMLAELLDKKLPVHASVKAGNTSGLADELKKLGFEIAVTASDGSAELYVWQPPAVAEVNAAAAPEATATAAPEAKPDAPKEAAVLTLNTGPGAMADLTQRAATINDMKGIWSLVREAAADSSVDLTTDAGQESALTEIMIGCSSELSPVTVAKDKTIVGAVLARRDELEWGLANANIIHVTFAAVAPSHKDQGVLQAMLSGLQAKKLPIHVSVKAGSKNGLTDALKGLGFEVATAAADGEVFVWDPPAAANGAAAAA